MNVVCKSTRKPTIVDPAITGRRGEAHRLLSNRWTHTVWLAQPRRRQRLWRTQQTTSESIGAPTTGTRIFAWNWGPPLPWRLRVASRSPQPPHSTARLSRSRRRCGKPALGTNRGDCWGAPCLSRGSDRRHPRFATPRRWWATQALPWSGWCCFGLRLSAQGTHLSRARWKQGPCQSAGAKTWSTPKPLRARAHQSWMHQWGSILSCTAARAFVCSLLGVHGNLGTDGLTWAPIAVWGSPRKKNSRKKNSRKKKTCEKKKLVRKKKLAKKNEKKTRE